jgi:hypothetical protein
MNRRKRNRLLDVGTGALLGFLLGLIGVSAYQTGNLDNLAKMLAVLALMLGAVVAMMWLIYRLWGPGEEDHD